MTQRRELEGFAYQLATADAQKEGRWWATEGDGSETEDIVLKRLAAEEGLHYEGFDYRTGELRFLKSIRVTRETMADEVRTVKDMRRLLRRAAAK